MKFLIILLTCLFFISQGATAQQCTPVYKNEYSGLGIDHALCVSFTADNGSIVGGRSTSNSAGDFDAIIMKLSENGELEWTKSFGGIDYEEIYRIKQTPDGGYIAIGLTSSFGNANGELFVLKLTAQGNKEWSYKYIADNTKRHRAYDIITLSKGGFAFVGEIADSTENSDALVTKIDNSGIIVWSKIFDNGDADGFRSIVEEKDSLVIGGFSHDGAQQRDLGLVVKLNPTNGNVFKSLTLSRNENISDVYRDNLRVISVGLINNGISISASHQINTDGRNGVMNLKLLNNGNIIYKQYTPADGLSGQGVQFLKSYPSNDSGFINLSSDKSFPSYSTFTHIGRSGLMEYGRTYFNVTNTEPIKMCDIAQNKKHEYIAVGFIQNMPPFIKEKIQVYKMDNIGMTGKCSNRTTVGGDINFNIEFKSSSWAFVKNTPDQALALNIDLRNNEIVLLSSCKENYCIESPVYPDNCNATFLLNLRGLNGKFIAADATPASDGGYIVAGIQYYNYNKQPAVVKLKPNGSVQWSKNYFQMYTQSDLKKILPTKDGNYLLIGLDESRETQTSSTRSFIFKINNEGNVLWKYNISTDYPLSIYNITPTDDGGFIYCANGDWGSGGIYNYIASIDGSGKSRWENKRRMDINAPILKAIYIRNNDLYIAGDDYSILNTIHVQKRNLSNGNLEWDREIELTQSDRVFANSLMAIGDTVYVAVSKMKDTGVLHLKYNSAIIKLNDKGKIVGDSYSINSINYSYDNSRKQVIYETEPRFITNTSDGHFITAQLTQDKNQEFLSVAKFQASGKKVWVKNFKMLNKHVVWSIKENDEDILITGLINRGDEEDDRSYRSFILNLDRNGNIKTGIGGDCENEDGTFVIDKMKDVKDNGSEFSSTTDFPALKYENRETIVRENNVLSMLSCYLPATCNSIKITGQDSICDLSKNYKFDIIKNTGCSSPSGWQIDTLNAEVINISDTSIELKFKKYGNYNFTARLSAGCKFLSFTKSIKVIQPSNTLFLGNDSAICRGNILILKAGEGFASYKWQDGSNDSSLQVVEGGKYFVTVKDFCGRSFTDTINITVTNQISVDPIADKIICKGDTAVLTAREGYKEYNWLPQANANISIVRENELLTFPLSSTLYFLEVQDSNGCYGKDTINVVVNSSPVINLGSDTSLCKGARLILNAGSLHNRYSWNTGDTSNTVTIAEKGFYIVTVTDINSCKSADTLEIKNVFNLPAVNLPAENSLCEGDVVELNAGSGFVKYEWSTGESAQSIIVSLVNSYAVTVTDRNGCKGGDTSILKEIYPLPNGFLPSDKSICSYETLSLTPNESYVSYLWSTNGQSKEIKIKTPGTYWLEVVDAMGCKGKDSINVILKDCLKGFYVPNAFTPNGDGKNDNFKALIYGNITKYNLSVYNRFGELVFKSSDISKVWDGYTLGKKSPTGTYAWICIYQFEGEPEKRESGTVTLIR